MNKENISNKIFVRIIQDSKKPTHMIHKQSIQYSKKPGFVASILGGDGRSSFTIQGSWIRGGYRPTDQAMVEEVLPPIAPRQTVAAPSTDIGAWSWGCAEHLFHSGAWRDCRSHAGLQEVVGAVLGSRWGRGG
jgi:hypothetical protein